MKMEVAMNIVYISHLTNEISQGPNYSVPAQIYAQSKYDNVFWWNLTDAKQEFWLKTGLFHNIEEYPCKKILSLPRPFNCPDLVVFESFYYIDDIKLYKECVKRKIPYIIIPRSALTRQGQAQKRYKKIPANILLFKSMTKHAAAVQYLTKKEYIDSGEKWCDNYFIMPNGIQEKKKPVVQIKNSIKGVYIGRFDPYQKGLDLLLEACDRCSTLLRKNNISIELYGPERYNCRADYIKEIQGKNLTDILIVKEGVFGKEKQKVLESADFFVMTSRFEGMPMSLIEAMSYGLPCLITTGTNMADIVDKNEAGWTAEVDLESIVRSLENMVEEMSSFEEKAINAWLLSRKYNWNAIAKKSHDIYKNMVL